MIAFRRRVSDDEACRALLEAVRWPNGPVCPRRGAAGRASRIKTRPGLWACRACRRCQFTVTAGTPLHRTHLPLTKWFLAIWLIATSSKGISGLKLAEWLDVSYHTAWYLGHRVRHMLAQPAWRKLTDVVDVDEMYVGGRKKPEDDDPGPGSGASRRGRGAGRSVVLVAAQRNGPVRAMRIATHSSAEIGRAVLDLVAPDADLITDGLPAYRRVGCLMASHRTVAHGRRAFSDRAGAHVNTAEGFIGLFRRAVQGTWHWISRKHVEAYAAECAWRHNRRDAAAIDKLIEALSGLSAGPLGYRELVA